jgi:hypothetical protein
MLIGLIQAVSTKCLIKKTAYFEIVRTQYTEIFQTRYPDKAPPAAFFAVLSWLLAMAFGVAFWTLLFVYITPTIVRLIHR